MCTGHRPSHLLLLDEPLADDLVDGRLDKPSRDRLAVPVTISVIRDRRLAHLTMHGDCIDECPAETSHPTGPKSNLGRRCLSATCSRFRLFPRRFVNW